MLLAKLSFTTPAGRELTVVTGADTAEMYLKMGYTLIDEYDDGWVPEDMIPVAPELGETAVLDAPVPAADTSEAGSEADDQEGN